MTAKPEAPRVNVIAVTSAKERARRPAPTLEHRPAIHEAGHALVARLVGLPVFSVALDDRGGGVTRHGYAGPDDDTSLRDQLAVRLGGIAGEYVTGHIRVIHGGQDLFDADRLARRLTSDPHGQLDEVGSALRRALDLLAGHRSALAALAEMLGADRSIRTQADVRLAIDVALAARPADAA